MVTVWVHRARLLQLSLASQVRVAWKLPPEPALVTVPMMATNTAPQLSLAVGSSKLHSWAHSTVLLLAQVMTGAMVSLTVMICTQEAELVQSSVTVWVRRIVPPQMPPTSGPSEQV